MQEDQVSERVGDRPAQRVAGQMQRRHTATLGRHPEPLRQRRVGQPVSVVRPARAAGRVVQGFQRRPVQRSGGRVGDRDRGSGRRAQGDPGRQRAPEAEHDRFAVVEHVVLESSEAEGRGGVRVSDGHAGRHSRVVDGGRPAARRRRQPDRQRPGRPFAPVDQAHDHQNASTLGCRVARCAKGDAQRAVASEARRAEVRDVGQPRLHGRVIRHAYAGALDGQRLEP